MVQAVSMERTKERESKNISIFFMLYHSYAVRGGGFFDLNGAALGGGTFPAPVGVAAEINKAAQDIIYPTPHISRHKPLNGFHL